jgi:hypothetical protein
VRVAFLAALVRAIQPEQVTILLAHHSFWGKFDERVFPRGERGYSLPQVQQAPAGYLDRHYYWVDWAVQQVILRVGQWGVRRVA